MNHDDAVRQMLTEQYLLNELTPELREEFEEHFFGCEECALNLRATAAFIEQSKGVLAARPTEKAAPVPARSWAGWLRPAWVLPVMALLLIVIGYQNFVSVPKLNQSYQDSSTPRILPAVSLINVATRGNASASVAVHKGEPFLIFVDVPADNRFSSYIAGLQGPTGKSEWSIPVSAEAAKDTVSIRVPAQKSPGQYTLVVTGIAPGANPTEIGHFPFEVKVLGN